MDKLGRLPEAFADLASIVEEWGGLDTPDERFLRRQQLPMTRLQAYYDLVQPRLEEIFDHLDSFPFGPPLPEPEALLFRLTLAMAEVAQAVEVYGQPTVPNVPADCRFTITPVERA